MVADNPNGSKIRGVTGPPGSGKSFALTARAARLAAEGKSVLVLCFNLTLSHRLRGLVVERCAEYGANPARVTAQLCDKLAHNAVMMQLPIGLENAHAGIIDLVTMKARYFDGENGETIREEEMPEGLRHEADAAWAVDHALGGRAADDLAVLHRLASSTSWVRSRPSSRARSTSISSACHWRISSQTCSASLRTPIPATSSTSTVNRFLSFCIARSLLMRRSVSQKKRRCARTFDMLQSQKIEQPPRRT
jgi:hypothetical protein